MPSWTQKNMKLKLLSTNLCYDDCMTEIVSAKLQQTWNNNILM